MIQFLLSANAVFSDGVQLYVGEAIEKSQSNGLFRKKSKQGLCETILSFFGYHSNLHTQFLDVHKIQDEN